MGKRHRQKVTAVAVLTDREHVDRLARVAEDLRRLLVVQDDAVKSARLDGVSWQKIAEAVGITRQGAQHRWDE
jgi:CRP-like cAMP-binding protein